VLGRTQTTVGLDIGSSSIKVVELTGKGSDPRLVHFGMAELAPETIVDGEVMDRQLVIETIQNLFERTQVRNHRVATGVSGRGVIVKKITMDRLPPQEAREAIHWEAEQHVPYDINDVALDFEILRTDVGPTQMQVLLVAAKRDLISAHADLVREAGLVPAVIDVHSFAVQNAVELNYEFLPNEVVALINIGAELTNINLVLGGVPLYTQDLPLGGNAFLDGLQKKHGVSRADAFASLRPGDAVPGIDLDPALRTFCADLSTALERSLVYLKSSGDADKLDRVLLSGGGARIHGLVPILAERLKVPVEAADMLRRLQFAQELFSGSDPHEVAPQLAVGLGLALRKVRAK
jgi:type IV pilus assembly protein PilM